MPGATDESRLWPQHFDAQVGELQRSHLMAGTRIGRLIAVQGRWPSTGLLGAGEESQVGGVPVSRHESVKVVMIPCVLLGAQDVFNGLCTFCAVVLLGCLRDGEGRDQDENDWQGFESVLMH